LQKIDISTNHKFKNKKATFLLACSVTHTCDIEGITQAGIPSFIHLTPTLDSEFLSTGEVASMPQIAQTPKGVPTPAIITRAIKELVGFSSLEFLDLGYSTRPRISDRVYTFGISPSSRIDEGANIDAKEIFEKAREFAKSYMCDSEYIILAETTPSGTTTAEATARALGYECDGLFASTFNTKPSIKQETIQKSLSLIDNSMSTYQKLSITSDNMIIFNAGFVLEVSKRYPVVLAGGTQMASVLLTLDKIAKEQNIEISSQNISLFTTKWIASDTNSDIEKLLNQLSFKVDSFYADFDFELSSHPALKLYDNGEAKEGVGCGATLCYGYLNGYKKEEMTKAIESTIG
jgi:uncharacterized protein (TIGR00303 family)